MKISIKNSLLCLVFIITNQLSSFGGNVNWLNPSNGNWNTGANWSGGSVPGINDTAVITIAGTYTVTMNVATSVAKLVIGGSSGTQKLYSSGFNIDFANQSTVNDSGLLEIYSTNLGHSGVQLQNFGTIHMYYSNIISANVVNNSSGKVRVSHTSNTWTGSFINNAGGQFISDAASSTSNVTFSNGWVNDGTILIKSLTGNHAQLTVTTGNITNNGIISTESGFGGNRYLYCAINNTASGIMNINWNTYWQNGGSSTNAGTINIASAYFLSINNTNLNMSAGTLNGPGKLSVEGNGVFSFNGGSIPGHGRFYVSLGTLNMNAGLPAWYFELYQCTLTSSAGSLNNTDTIHLYYTNTITANIINTSTGVVRVSHTSNTWPGNFTNNAGGQFISDALSSTSNVTFSNGWINNGTITLKSLTGNHSQLTVTTGSITNNGTISTESGFAGNRYLYCSINNTASGIMNINWNTYWQNGGSSTNAGTINIASAYFLSIYNTNLNMTAGTLNGPGKLSVEGSGVFSFNGGSIPGHARLYVSLGTLNMNAGLPAWYFELYQCTLTSSAGSLNNTDTIHLYYTNTITANIINTSTGVVRVSHTSNTWPGNFTNNAGGQFISDALSSTSNVTFSNGWINNGTITLKSLTGNHSQLTVTTGSITNNGTISTENGFAGNRYLYCSINNTAGGIMNINWNTYWQNGGSSTNTGTINIASAYFLSIYNTNLNMTAGTLNGPGKLSVEGSGVFSYNGGSIPGHGRLYVSVGTLNMNAGLPAWYFELYQCTLASSAGSLNNTDTIHLYYTNTISANIINTSTGVVRVSHTSNTWPGSFTNNVSGQFISDALSSTSNVTFSNGWANAGTLTLKSLTGNHSHVTVTSGVITNTGTISTEGGFGGNRYLNTPIDNQGIININWNTYIQNAGSGHSHFTSGTTTIGGGYWLEWNGGIHTFTGGIITGSGTMVINNAHVANFNVAVLPDINIDMYASTLASTFLPITNISTHLHIFYNNTITAAIFNTDTITVSHATNLMTGALTTSATSVLRIDGGSSTSTFTVSSGFTNNGLIELKSLVGYNTSLSVTSGNLINAPGGIIRSYGPSGGTRTLNAALTNQGTLLVDYSLTISNTGVSSNIGNIIISNAQKLTYDGGTLAYNGGSLTGTGTLYFNNCVDSVNVVNIPNVFTQYYNSKLRSSLPLINNLGTIELIYGDTIFANLNNKSTGIINVSQYANVVSGNFTNEAGSLIAVNGATYTADLTFNNGFTNNGKIDIKSLVGYNTALYVSTGEIINLGTIHSYGPSGGTRTLGANVNNQGTLTVDYTLLISKTNALHTNTGNVTIASGQKLTFDKGSLRWNGGTASGTGTLYFNNCIDSVNVANIPGVFTQFYASYLRSNLPLINNFVTIELIYGDTIFANLNNKSTGIINVSQYANVVSGNFTNEAGSLIAVNGATYTADLTFNNGFTNNGKIDIKSLVGYGTSLFVNTGEILNLGTIHSYGPSGGTRTLGANVNNQGTLTVDYTLLISKTNALHTNTGNVTIASGQKLTFDKGSLSWNGGTASGAGTLYFNNCIDSVNVANIPTVFTQFYTSKLRSTLALINNLATIELIYGDTISANLLNKSTGIINVSQYANVVSGNFSNEVGSLLAVNGATYTADLTFNNGFTNNGTIDIKSLVGYGTALYLSTGVLTNATSGIINSTGPSVGSRNFSGQFSNSGILNIAYPITCISSSFVNEVAGTIKGTAQLTLSTTLLVNKGTISPGASPGTLSVSANIANKPTSIWNIEIGGLTAGTQHDKLINNFASKTDSIGGTLNISLINGFVPSLGDSVIIETHNLRVGTFATITGQTIPGGLYWNIFYRTNHITLRAGNPPNLNIVSSSGPNGTISPLGTVSIVYNGTQTYNMVPGSGYRIDSVIVDGTFIGTMNSYTFSNVIADHTIYVVFAVITFPITASVTGNGIISPSGITNVPQFSNQTYTITPDPCYLIDSLIVNGANFGALGSFTFNSVNAPHSIRAVFRNAPKISANGPLSFCIGDSVTLDAGSGYLAYAWSNGASTQTTTVSTSNTYTCTITSTGACTNSSAVSVTVNPLPVVSLSQPFAPDNGHTCLSGGGINLSLSNLGQPAGGGYSGVGVVNNFYQIYSSAQAGLGTNTLTYTYTDPNGCSNSAAKQIIVDQNATVNAGTDIVLCNVLIANLNATANVTAGVVNWTTNGSGSFSNINSLTSSYTLSSADSAAGSVVLTLTSSDPFGPCDVVSDLLNITYNPDAIPNAGPSQICTPATVALSGSIFGYASTPLWTTTGTGTFTNANSLNTNYTASAQDLSNGNVKLILTPIDPQGNCIFGSDTLEAWFDPNYTVNAGTDKLLCSINDTIATLNGSYSNASQVTWSNGNGTFGNINDAATNYILSASDRANGYITLVLTTNDPVGACSSVSDNMIVRYKYAIPNIVPTDICGDTITAVSGNVSTNALSGSTLTYLWTTSGSGMFSFPNLASTTYSASNNDLVAGKVKLYFTPVDGSGECIYEKDSVTIWFTPHYTIDAGPDTASVCSNGILNLNGTKQNAISTVWTTSGSGSFGNPSLLSTTYTPSISDSLSGYVILSLTTNDPEGPCSNVIDSIYIIIHPAPDASAGSNSPVCFGQDLDLTASGGTSYVWNGPNGFSSTDQNIIRTPSDYSMAGQYNVIVTNVFGCINPASTFVTINPCGCTAPVLFESHSNVSCFGGNNGSINLIPAGGSGGNTFLWSNEATTEDISGLTYGIYTVTVTTTGGCTATLSITITQPPSLPVVTIVPNGPTSFCAGGNVTLNAGSGFTNYLWSTSAITPSIIVDTTGTFIVTVHDLYGCTATDSIDVYVGPAGGLTGVNINASPSESICIGESATFIATPINGGSSPTYAWTVNGSAVGSNSNIYIDSTLTNASIVKCVMTSNSGCIIGPATRADSITMTVNYCPLTIVLKVFIEGFYNISGQMPAVLFNNSLSMDSSACDYLTVELHKSISPFSMLYSSTGIININGDGNFIFPAVASNTPYYIVVKHRNAVETWSKNPVLINNSTINYDFTR